MRKSKPVGPTNITISSVGFFVTVAVRCLMIVLFLAMALISCAQDSIKFRSASERRAFEAVLSGKNVSDLSLLTFFDSDSATLKRIEQKLSVFYSLLPKLSGKKPEIAAKIIFEEGQKLFLFHYVDTASFTSVFGPDPIFNCVSGTAFYAVVLQHFGISFEIKEIPSHIYLVANPGSKPIMMESTSRNGFVFTEEGKNIIVKQILSRGLITRERVEQLGASGAFAEYFYPRSVINLRELAGIQYSNRALLARQQKDYKKSLNELTKSDILYPNARNKYYNLEILGNIMNTESEQDPDRYRYAIKYFYLDPTPRGVENINRDFKQFIQQTLIERSDTAKVRAVFEFLLTAKDSALQASIKNSYYGGMAFYYGQKREYELALRNAEIALASNSGDALMQTFIVEMIEDKHHLAYTNLSTLKALELYQVRFPFLRDRKDFKIFYIVTLAGIARVNFVADHAKEGEKYLSMIVSRMKDLGAPTEPENFLAYAYAEAGAYYYRIHEFKRALQVMNIGLGFAPEHPELLERMKIVREEMKARGIN